MLSGKPDHMSTWMYKPILPHLLSFITAPVNQSFRRATTMLTKLKYAITHSLPKNIDMKLMNTIFRLVSNLGCTPKVIKSAVTLQYVEYIIVNKFSEPNQPIDMQYHST